MLLQLFYKGGPIMWPLLVLSLVAVTVMIERFWFLVRERMNRNARAFEGMIKFLLEGRKEKALEIALGTKDPVARVIGYGLQNSDVSFEDAVSRAAEKDLDRFTNGLAILDTAITLAPLLGLLGTVTGMISAFSLLGGSELEAPAAITGGIAEALIATAFGLGIAILSLLPFNMTQRAREKRVREIEDRASQVELILKKQLNGEAKIKVA